jgi:hypothetical protein
MSLACPLRIHFCDNGIEPVDILTSTRETMKNAISTSAADITARAVTEQ